MNRAPLLALAALSLATTPPALAEQAAPAAWTWDLPFYVPPPRVPADNPMSEAKFQLGRHLFYDKRLSGNGTLSCGSCHLQARAFTDGRMTGVGSTGEHTPRNPPSIVNSAWHATYTLGQSGACVTLERQTENPNVRRGERPIEMGVNDANRAEIVARFRADADYRRWFARRPFPKRSIRSALRQSSRRSRLSNAASCRFNSRYDQYLQGKEKLTEAETAWTRSLFRRKG